MGMVSRADAYQRRHRWAALPVAVLYKFGDDQGSYLAAQITYYGSCRRSRCCSSWPRSWDTRCTATRTCSGRCWTPRWHSSPSSAIRSPLSVSEVVCTDDRSRLHAMLSPGYMGS
jgi:hypothetical protein